MSCSADYYLVTCSQRRLLCADVCSAQNVLEFDDVNVAYDAFWSTYRKCTAPSQFGIVGAANW
jgi:hypothetical protein